MQVGDTTTTLRRLAIVTNFGPQSPEDSPLLLANRESSAYVLDEEYIQRLYYKLTSPNNTSFLGPYEDHVKEQFVLSLLYRFRIEIHEGDLGEVYIPPFSHTFAAILLYLNEIREGLTHPISDVEVIDGEVYGLEDSREYHKWHELSQKKSELESYHGAVPFGYYGDDFRVFRTSRLQFTSFRLFQ